MTASSTNFSFPLDTSAFTILNASGTIAFCHPGCVLTACMVALIPLALEETRKKQMYTLNQSVTIPNNNNNNNNNNSNNMFFYIYFIIFVLLMSSSSPFNATDASVRKHEAKIISNVGSLQLLLIADAFNKLIISSTPLCLAI